MLMWYGGLLRLLHLSDEAETMAMYRMPQRTSSSSQEVDELLQETMLRSWASAVARKSGESSISSQPTRMVLLWHSVTAVMVVRAQAPG